MNNKVTSLLSDSLGTLTSLIQEPSSIDRLLRVALDKVKPDPNQPRKDFDENKLQELADSIEQQGVIQPIGVSEMDGDGIYTIQAGERRWRASIIAKGVDDIPVYIVCQCDVYAQMIENIQREDLTPMEIGVWCLARIKEGKKSKDIAKLLGKPDSFVSLHKELPKLPPYIMALYVKNVLTSPRLLIELKRAAQFDDNATVKFCDAISQKGVATKNEIDLFISDLKGAKKTKEQQQATPDPSSRANKPTPSKNSPKRNDGCVHVKIGNGEKIGQLVLNKAAESDDRVWVDFEGSASLMDVMDLRIVKVDFSA